MGLWPFSWKKKSSRRKSHQPGRNPGNRFQRRLSLQPLEERMLLSITTWIDSTQNAQEGVSAGYFRLKRDDTSGGLTVNYSIDTSNTTLLSAHLGCDIL